MLAAASDVAESAGPDPIYGNAIRETQAPEKRVGIRIGADADQITLADNRIQGFAQEVVDLRKNRNT